jgi:hypothetical protein
VTYGGIGLAASVGMSDRPTYALSLHVVLIALVLVSLAGCSGARGGDADLAGAGTPAGSDGGMGPSSDAGAATCTPSIASFDGTWVTGTSGPTMFHRFDNPAQKGLVVILHGTNGSSVSVARNKREWQSFHAAARASGYSLLVPESEERDKPRRWDNSPTAANPDIRRIVSLLDDARTGGHLPASAPVYVIGMSQGAGVAPIFAQLLASRGYPIRAVASYCGGESTAYARPEYTIPTTFAAMAADDVIPQAASAVAANVAALQARGIETTSYVKPVERLCSARFTRIPGVDAANSRAIFEGLLGARVVDASGTVLTHGSDLEGSAPPGIPASLAAFSEDVDEQLQVVAAGHAFFGDRNDATLAFFAAHP